MAQDDVLTFAHCSNAGPRDVNEDYARCGREPDVLVVADGLGGHPKGDRASRFVTKRLLTHLEDLLKEFGNLQNSPESVLEQAVLSAEGDLETADWATPEGLRFPATTCTALWWPSPDRWVLAHVGDSRAYRYHEGELRQISRDQTPVGYMKRQGRITREEARNHPRSHELDEALGLKTRGGTTVILESGDCAPGDLFLVCTDGLTDAVSEVDIVDLIHASLQDGRPADALAEELIERALAAETSDNVTVGVARRNLRDKGW